jgi:nicotinic acetylcholine receptor
LTGEKITLTISVLLSINVFLLLVSKILPPTSKTIPLMAKYLLLTLVLNVFTIMVTVVIINVYFRGPTTHRMPNWLRKTFLDFMPKFLGMKRPKPPGQDTNKTHPSATPSRTVRSTTRDSGNERKNTTCSSAVGDRLELHHPLCIGPAGGAANAVRTQAMALVTPTTEHDATTADFYPLTPDAQRAVEAIEYITDHLRQDEEYKMVSVAVFPHQPNGHRSARTGNT